MEAMRRLTEQEAMFVACEMEASAVALYTRALGLMQQLGRGEDALCAELKLMLSDEREHLRRFRSFLTGEEMTDERRMALAALAENVLFEGGLMGAARQGLLSDAAGMLRFAMLAEEVSARKYREFALLAEDPAARDALTLIAAEEEKHLAELRTQDKNL